MFFIGWSRSRNPFSYGYSWRHIGCRTGRPGEGYAWWRRKTRSAVCQLQRRSIRRSMTSRSDRRPATNTGFFLNSDDPFSYMPGFTKAALSFFEFPYTGGFTLLAPLTNGFVGNGDATFCQQFFDLTKAEAESKIQPGGVADNFRRKAEIAIDGC
jgi:hypothetical protein